VSAQRRVNPDEIAQRVAQFKATAKARGIKLTPQRLEIFREVASSLEHPDAETVYRAVHARMPTVSLDTVYRTLWMLNEMGLVSTLGVRRASVRFDANTREHHHYVCIRCGLTRDFESAALHELRLPDTINVLGSALSTHVEVRGVCECCTNRGRKENSTSNRRSKGRKGETHGRHKER
jgi:Fur family peroxide stress response transcriptional regulator